MHHVDKPPPMAAASNHRSSIAVDGDSIVKHFLTGENLRQVFAHLCNHASGQVTDPISDVVHTMLTCPVQMVISEVGVALFKDHPNALYPFSAMDARQRTYVENVVATCMSQFQQRDAAATASAGMPSSSDDAQLCCHSVPQQQQHSKLGETVMHAPSSCNVSHQHSKQLSPNVATHVPSSCNTLQQQHSRQLSPNVATHAPSSCNVLQQQQHNKQLSPNVVMQMGGGCILYAESSVQSSSSSSSSFSSLLRPKDVFETLCDCVFSSRR